MDAAKTKQLRSYPGKIYRHFMHNSLRRNSSLLIISQAINAAGAFIFWIVCAHLFNVNIIGLATAFISFAALASTFTNLGLPNTVIRFLPTSKKRGGLFAASFYIIFFVSIVGGLVALLLMKDLVPKLGFVHTSSFLSVTLIALIAGTAISALMDGTLMAFRKGEYILGKALIVNVPRIVLPFFIVSLGVQGITGIYAIVLVVGIMYNVFIAVRRLLKTSSFKPTLAVIGKHKSFAASNYFGGMFGVLPVTLVPIIVLGRLGAAPAAYFYMPMQIAAFLTIISSSTSQALISESSQSEDQVSHKLHFRSAFLHLYQMLIPAAVILCLASWPLLKLYGNHYASAGFLPLLVLAVASLFIGINWLGDTWLNIKKRTLHYFLMNAFNAIIVVGSVYIFAPHGLLAVSIGWLLGQVVSAAVYLAIFARGQLFTFVGSLKTS